MDDWRSYDRTAETYERVHALRFADVARDLAAFVEIGTGMPKMATTITSVTSVNRYPKRRIPRSNSASTGRSR